MTLSRAIGAVGVLALSLLTLAGAGPSTCNRTDTNSTYRPNVDPAAFVPSVTNPYFPLVPGTKLQYQETSPEGNKTIDVVVTHDTKRILGVPCVVVHDTVRLGSQLKEDTLDWYAQDRDGNVLYFGEATQSYESDGSVNTKGSWEAGVDGALPGIIMPATPRVGDPCRQEYYRGKAEDMAQIVSLSETATVPYGSFSACVKTRDWSALEPDVVENKWFARGIGQVRAEIVQGGTGAEELVRVTTE
jgi:hypothetical protein